jgi:hypothetical protein
MRQQRQADESAEDRSVQQERASEITGQVLADTLITTELEWGGYGTLLLGVLIFPAAG